MKESPHMASKLLLPQEIETFYVIPSLRRQLALYLRERGIKQKDIAELLGIDTAAISQYTSSKRGSRITFDTPIQEEIKKSAQLINNRYSYLKETQRLLRVIRETKTLCQIHKLFSPVPENCDPHETGCHSLPLKICI